MNALLLMMPAAFAWGPTGHRAVGEIAERHLTKRAARNLSVIMGSESLAQAANWPDEVRSDTDYMDSHRDSPKWHYINAPEGEDALSRPNEVNNIWRAFEDFRAKASDATRTVEERREAVRWIAHLAGDAHQPMHTGYASDRGGNSVRVNYFNEPTNLHKVWDEEIINGSRLSYTELADFADDATAEEIARLQASGIGEWLNESRALMPAAYELGDRFLSYSYVYIHTPTIHRRIKEAGIRLAGVLNAIFG